jgi:hypothetical protein
VSDEKEEQIEKAVGVVVPMESGGIISQGVKGVKAAFATKKAVMATYALLFGATVGAASYTAGGMTAAEAQRQQILEETVVTLREEVITLQSKIVKLDGVHTEKVEEHTVPDHTHDITHEHESTPHSHQIPEHEHDHGHAPAVVFQEHGHPESAKKIKQIEQHEMALTNQLYTIITHEHEAAPIVEDKSNAEKYKHKNPRHDTCAVSCHLPD